MGKNKHFSANSKSIELQKYVRLSSMNTILYSSQQKIDSNSMYQFAERSFYRPKKDLIWNENRSCYISPTSRKSIGSKLVVVNNDNNANSSNPVVGIGKKSDLEASDLKRVQRNQIYALNELMTKLEHEKFLKFCEQHNIRSESDE